VGSDGCSTSCVSRPKRLAPSERGASSRSTGEVPPGHPAAVVVPPARLCCSLQVTAEGPVVGDRVRVRRGVGENATCDELPHYPDEQGRTGAVVAVRAQPGAPNHPYLVMFDRPHPEGMRSGIPMPIAARHYAADELEVVGHAPNKASGARGDRRMT